MTILLADDEIEIVNLLVEMIKGLDHEVETAASGLEALEKLKSSEYSFFITDLNMPGLKLDDYILKLKELDLPKRPKIIIMTGDEGERAEKKCREQGLDIHGHINKPFSDDEFEKLLKSVLSETYFTLYS